MVGRATDTGESFVDGLSSSALLQPSPAAAVATGVVDVVGDPSWTNTCGASARRPAKSLRPDAAGVRHCATLGPGRSKDRAGGRHVPRDAGGPGAPPPPPRGPPPASWLDRPLMRLCRDDVRLLDKLGQGRFTEVYVTRLRA